MYVMFDGRLDSTKNAVNTNKKPCVKKEKFPGYLVIFDKNEKVNDEVRGILTFDRVWYFISVPQYIMLASTKPLLRLGLLLESPHKDEYQNQQPIRPANGVTGQKIEALIANRVAKWNSVATPNGTILQTTNDYEVILINAVQYQTSCYKLLGEQWDKTNREHVFKLLFNNFGLRTDLSNRINNYNLSIVVNCVTVKLKNEVSNIVSNLNSVADYHPSYW